MTCQDMSGHIFGHILNIFWHSIWRIFWLSIWQSIWHIFCPSTWLGIRHAIWHSFEWRNKTKQQVVLVSRFVSFWFPQNIACTRLMHTHPGFRNGLLTAFLSKAFVKGLCPTSYPDHLFHLARHCACQSVKQDININMQVSIS